MTEIKAIIAISQDVLCHQTWSEA